MAVGTAYAQPISAALRSQTGEFGDEPGHFTDGLEEFINDFRLPAGAFYNQLVGSERVLPSIESQVTHVQEHIKYWLSDAIEIAAEADFSGEDPDFTSAQEQVSDLCTRSLVSQSDYSNWQHNYQRSEQNVAGQFVAWSARRAVRATVKEVLGTTLPSMSKASQAPLPGTLSFLAKDKKVRRTAYQARMEAKIGLACLRAIPPQTIPHIEEYFQLGSQQTEVPDLMDIFARKQALAALGFSWIQPLTSLELDPLPF